MNIRPITFLDASVMTAYLLVKHKESFKTNTLRQKAEGSPHHDTETIILRGPAQADASNWFDDIDHIDYPILDNWKSARAMLTRIRNAVAPFNEGRPGEIGKAMVVSLKAGGTIDWHSDEGDYAERHERFHLCMVPSPGAWLYIGGESSILPVGQLTWVNNHVMHSAANFGANARVHLIVDIRKPDA